MAFMDVGGNLNDIPEQKPVPEGEYTLVIEGTKFNDKNKCLNVRAAIEGEPDAATVFHNISFPAQEDDDEKKLNKLRFMKLFLDKFGISYSDEGFNEEDLIGETAVCHLIEEEYKGKVNNRIKL